MTGETSRSDFYGIVLNAAVAAMDGCPWIEKGRVLQIAEGIAESVTDRVAQVDSITLPGGETLEGRPRCCQVAAEPRICHCHLHWHPHRRSDDCERFIERQNKIDALIEASSLGTAQAKAIRDSVDDESVQRILDRVNKRRS